MTAPTQDDLRSVLDMAAGWAAYVEDIRGADDVGAADVECLRRVAVSLDVDPSLVTPARFRSDFPHEPEPKVVMRSTARVKMTLRPGDVWRGPDGAACGISETYRHVEEGACGVKGCDKPWTDGMHLTGSGQP